MDKKAKGGGKILQQPSKLTRPSVPVSISSSAPPPPRTPLGLAAIIYVSKDNRDVTFNLLYKHLCGGGVGCYQSTEAT